MRHAPISQGLLAAAMSLASVRCALVLPPRFALARPIAQLLALPAAVALASKVADAHIESLAALETSDFDEVELIRTGHPAGEVRVKLSLV